MHDEAAVKGAKHLALIGGTGLVGSLLLAQAKGRSDVQITSLARRAGHGVAVDFEAMLNAPEATVSQAVPNGADVAISCLGTTIRKAGSQAAMWRIDHDYVLAFAHGAKAAGARQFILMTSVGAGGSGFYLQTKGEVEEAVGKLGFERLDLIRPGLLLGDRAERRLAERAGQAVAPLLNLLLVGGLSRYQALHAETVAAAVLALAGQRAPGRFVHENAALRRLAG